MIPQITSRHDFEHPPARESGMTLLEVLVALGILVAGLASVAALLPAASARLADATAIDRAGTLAANAHADLRTRGILVSSTLFGTSTVVTATTSHVRVLGSAFPNSPFTTGTTVTAGSMQVTFLNPSITALPVALMTLQDDIQLTGTGVLSTNTTSVSYGVTVVPTATGTVSAGSPVRVGVVVFKQPTPEWRQITLTGTGPGLPAPVAGTYRVVVSSAATPAENEAARKRFLPACSWAFAVSGVSGANPTPSCWLQVGSSWMFSGTSGTSSIVRFSDPGNAIVSSSTLTVQAFSGVLRADERPAILK